MFLFSTSRRTLKASVTLAIAMVGSTASFVSAGTLMPWSVSPDAAAVSAYNQLVINTPPTAFYRLNDTDGTLRDSSSHAINGHYGSSVPRGNAPITTSGDADPYFPGGTYNASHFASASLNGQLQPSSALTIEAWFRSAAIATKLVPIVTYGKASQGPAYALYINPQNALQVSIKTSSGTINVEGFTNLRPGVVYHAAATFDGRTTSLYLNGALQRSYLHSGTIFYHELNSHDGLGIGGALDGSAPVFVGNISQVAIYNRALPTSAIVSHYSVGNEPQNLNEHASSTAAFIDSIGLNTHFHYTNSVYSTQWPKMQSLMIGLGIRHIRDGLVESNPAYLSHLETLGKSGIRSTLTTDSKVSASTLVSFPSRVPDSFEAYEPPNEPDLNGGSNWIANTRAFQSFLYRTVKGNRNTAKYAVLGPALTNSLSYKEFGNMSSFIDTGNVHMYFPGYNPGTDGYGSRSTLGIVGSLEWLHNVSQIDAPARASELTETGFNFASNTMGTVPQDVATKYLPRLFLESFNMGFRRTYEYQLADWESEPYFEDGLVYQNMTPKPAYYALQSFIKALYDAHPPAQTSTLRYTLKGNIESVHHTLLQRGDGTYDLALWVESRSLVPTQHTTAQTRIAVPAHAITIALPSVVRAVAGVTVDTRGALANVPVGRSGSVASLSVTDAVTIVHFML